MAGSGFGEVFRVTTWGESHGEALGAVVDGVPAGLILDKSDIQAFLDRRKPGQTKYSTPRKENDEVEILSGVFEGKTTGTPISLMIRNTSQRSGDYSEIAGYYRPGHADYTFDKKYGFRDYRGGGRSSARETAARVAAGAIATKLLEELGISVRAYVKQIGPHAFEPKKIPTLNEVEKSPLRIPDEGVSAAAEDYLDELKKKGDSAGGIIECVVSGVPAGLGDPVFNKLDALLSMAVFSIGAVKGVEIGDGFSVAATTGSQNNDSFISDKKSPYKSTNHAGGILGGISDGDDIVIRAAFKPTPSITASQKTINKDGEQIDISVKGRHDPVIVPRAVFVVESKDAIVLADRVLADTGAKINTLKDIYGKS